MLPETCDATSTPYTAPFTVEKGDVVRAMAIDGEKASQVVEATITWLKTEYASLAEFIAEKPAHLVTFTCPFTAIYQDGKASISLGSRGPETPPLISTLEKQNWPALVLAAVPYTHLSPTVKVTSAALPVHERLKCSGL